MKITIAVPSPNTIDNWDNPTDFMEKEITVSDTIISVEPVNWNGKIGNRVYFLKEGEKNLYTYWHFVTSTLLVTNIKPLGIVPVNENQPAC